MLRLLVTHPVRALLCGALLFTTAGWGVDRWNSTKDLREAKEAQTELLLDVAEADSIAHAVGERNEDLLQDLSETSERMERLAQNLEATESRNSRLTEMLASARAELDSTGTVHIDTTVARECDRCLMPGDSVTGRLRDSVFTVDWVFIPMDSMKAKIRADIRARLVSTELPDGGVAVFAEPLSPGVDLAVDRFEYTPPEPPDPGFDFSSGFWGYAAGVISGIVGWEFAR